MSKLKQVEGSIAAAAALALVSLALVMLSPSVQAATVGPFGGLQGNWSGTGRILLEGGNAERLTCRADYGQRDSGRSLTMSIRCASPSYRIELRASLTSSGSAVSGTWEERTFNAGGTTTGRASGGDLNLVFTGNVNGRMSVNLSTRRQSVSITADGGGFRGVTISMSRR